MAKTVSLRLDTAQNDLLEAKAKERGITKAELMREMLSDVKTETSVQDEQTPGALTIPAKIPAGNVSLSDETLLHLAGLISKIVPASLPAQREEKPTIVVSPEREYLRKLAGKEPEQDITLTDAEEAFLQTLSEGIKADVTENLLQEHNSVPIEDGFTPAQKRVFMQMIAKRNEIISESTPSLQTIMKAGALRAFVDDAKTLYNRKLFASTYGIKYAEFEAIFLK